MISLSRFVVSVCMSVALACAPAYTPAPGVANNTGYPTVKLLRTGHRVVGYYPAWASMDPVQPYSVAQVPADVLTHLNYAFANISEAGEITVGFPQVDTLNTESSERQAPFHGNYRELVRLKARFPHLRTLISVGGWDWSGRFSMVAATEQARQRFARSVATFLVRFDFDGVDIDWEYPATDGRFPGRAEDSTNFTLLLAAVRRALDEQELANRRRYFLTIAAPGDVTAARKLNWTAIQRYVDWINVMAYDFAGSWSDKTLLNGALYPASRVVFDGSLNEQANARDLLFSYLEANVPADKVVLGVSSGGKTWMGVPDGNNNGLYQPYNGAEVLPTTYLRMAEVRAGMQEFWHEKAQVPWLYDPDSGLMITYENARSMWLKGAFAREHRLGGVMLWQIAADDSSHILLRSLVAGVMGDTGGGG